MKSRHRFSKRLLAIAAVFGVLSGLYLHFGLCPERFKPYVAQKIFELSRKKVIFDKALYLPFRGLCLTNVMVFEPDGRPFFRAREAAIDIALLPFLSEKKVLVKRLTLERPRFDLALVIPALASPPKPVKTQISGQINVPIAGDQLSTNHPKFEDMPEALLPDNVYLELVNIRDGIVTVRSSPGRPVLEEIRDLHLSMEFNRPPVLQIAGSLKLGSLPGSALRIKGSWNLQKPAYELLVSATSPAIPDWLKSYQKNRWLALNKAAFSLEAFIKSASEDHALFRANFFLSDADFSLDKTRVLGAAEVHATGLFDLTDKIFERYQGVLELDNVTLLGLSEKTSRLDKISAKVRFQPEQLNIDSLRGQYQNVPFLAAGSIRSFSDPVIDGTITSRLRIERLLSMLPAQQTRILKDIDLQGGCHALIRVKGPLKKPAEIKTEPSVLLNNVSLETHDQKLKISGLSCQIHASPQGLKIGQARFDWAGQRCSADLFLPSRSDTAGSLTFNSPTLALSADFLWDAGSVSVQKSSLTFEGITAAAHGKILGLPRAHLDLEGNFDADLDRLTAYTSRTFPETAGLKLNGRLSGIYQLKGPLDRSAEWDLKADASSDRVLVSQKLSVDDFEVQLRMKNGIINLPYFHAKPYSGTLGGRLRFRPDPRQLLVNGSVYGHTLSLGRITSDWNRPKPGIDGTLSFQLNLNGNAKDPKTLYGNGSLAIHNGRLWESNLFHQLGQLPLVKIEGLDRVTFTDLSGSFLVKDGRMWTEDLSVKSETVFLTLKGSLDFSQNLDLLMSIRYSGDVVRGAQDAGGIAPFMVMEAEKNIPKHRITGPLSDPKFEKI